jgi:glycosyltransferase involved in cell wall biosynthesis
LSGARNTGIKNSSGKYIAFLDPDDQLTENSLQVRLDAIERDTSLGVVFSNMYLVKDGNLLKRTYADSFAQIYENDIFPDIIRHNFIFMPTVLLRRDVFESCGFFDESLVRAEDYDMWIRTARYGWKFKYIDLQTAYYYLRDDSLSMDIGKNMTALIRIYENLIQDETISEKARILARHSWRTSSLRLHINSARRSIESEDYNNAKDSMKKLIDLKYKTIKFYLLIFILKISPKFFKKMYIFFYDEQIKQ